MKNSVQKITEQAKTRDTQGRFKVALADINTASAIELVELLKKVQLFYSQDNKDKTTQIILTGTGSETIVLDFRLKTVRPLGSTEHWEKQIAIDAALGRIDTSAGSALTKKKKVEGGKEND